jgi:hypothetical protein
MKQRVVFRPKHEPKNLSGTGDTGNQGDITNVMLVPMGPMTTRVMKQVKKT